jgi:thiol-disulfide isomerase/thioredoxin
MVTKQDVVTPQRFTSAMTYQQYIDQIGQNKDEFMSNYTGTAVPQELKQRLQALVAKPNGPKKVLVLGEDWCPDVFRGMPVVARIAEAAGMEMKVMPRDQNLDVMNNYLNKGEFQSVPTLLFYTKDMELILAWHERPQKANDEMPEMRKLYEGRSREEAMPDIKKFRAGPIWAGWRQATIEEITRLLEEKVA